MNQCGLLNPFQLSPPSRSYFFTLDTNNNLGAQYENKNHFNNHSKHLARCKYIVSNENVVANFSADSSKPIKSFEEYSQMSNLKERITAINKETPKNKSFLWRQNVIYKADRMNLNQEQKVWVKDVYDFIDENFFALAGGNESEFNNTDLGKSYEKLMVRESELFTRDDAKKFCIIIGDDSTLINSQQESSSSDGGTCNCASSLCGQCPSDEDCFAAYCSATPSGCGCFAVWACTKKCGLGLPLEN